jgi:energy-coupling factor transporter ATP-binding protein EcfA2
MEYSGKQHAKENVMDIPITQIEIRNFLGIKDLSLSPGKVTIIRGPNASGKSSFLKAIEAAFKAKGLSASVIHGGQNSAEVLVDVGDMKIDRRFTPKGTYIDVERDDATLKSPQSVLDKLMQTPLAFNPVDFYLAKPAEQREMLLKAIPITVSPEDVEKWFGDIQVDTDKHGLEVMADIEKLAYGERQVVARRKKELLAERDAISGKIPSDFDVDRWRAADVSEYYKQLSEAEGVQSKKDAISKQIGEHISQAEILKQRKLGIEEQIKNLQAQVAGIVDDINTHEQQAEQLNSDLESIDVPDVEDVKQALAEHTAAQRVLQDYDELAEILLKLHDVEEQWDTWDRIVEDVRSKPNDLLKAANIPIDGLDVTPDEIKLDGVAIEHLSGSEKLLLALRVVRAINSGLPIICIDGAEQLDEKSMNVLKAEMENDDFQYFVTRVEGDVFEIETGPDGGQLQIETEDE